MEFKSLFKGAKFKANQKELDYLATLQKKYGNLISGFEKRGVAVPPVETKKSTLSKILGGLGTWDRTLSTVASHIYEKFQGKPVSGKDWLGALAGAMQVGDLPIFNKYKTALKTFLPEYEKHEEYDWIKFYEEKVGIGKEFAYWKSLHEKDRAKVLRYYERYPWLKSKWVYLIPGLGQLKMGEVAENVFYNLTKSPAALAGLGTSIVTDPITYTTFGVGKGATIPLKLGSELAEELATKVGRQAIKETGEIALSSRGLGVLRDVATQTENLAKYTKTGQKIMKEAGEEALGRAIREVSTTGELKSIAKFGGKKIPKTNWEQVVVSEASKAAYQKAAFKVAQKQVGESLLKPGLYKKFVDIGGIKFMGQTVIPGSVFEKIGFRKLGKLITESSIGKPIAKGIRNIFTAKGTAPEELYDVFRYHMDFQTNFQKRNLEDDIIDFFNKSGLSKEQRINVTKYLAMPDRAYSNTADVIMKSEYKDDVIDSILNSSNKISAVDKSRLTNLTTEIKKLKAQLTNMTGEYLMGKKRFNLDEFVPESELRFKAINSKEADNFIKTGEINLENFIEDPREVLKLKNKNILVELENKKLLTKDIKKARLYKYNRKTGQLDLIYPEVKIDVTSRRELNAFLKQSDEAKQVAEKLVKVDQVRTIGLAKILDDPIANLTNTNSYIDNIVEEVAKKRLYPERKVVSKVTLRTETEFRDLTKEAKIRIAKRMPKTTETAKVITEIPEEKLMKASQAYKNLQAEIIKVKQQLTLFGQAPLDKRMTVVRQTLETRLAKLEKKFSHGNLKSVKLKIAEKVKPTTIQYQARKGVKPLELKTFQTQKNIIQKEVDNYLTTLNQIKQRPILGDAELMTASKARTYFQDLLEKERAYGLKVKTYRNYLPSIRPMGVSKKSPYAKPLQVGPEVPGFAKAKEYRTPIEAAEAGVPTELDIGILMYRRGAKSINAVARKKFFQEARQFGKKIVTPAEKFNYTKLPIKEIGDLYFPNEYAKFITRARDFLSDEGTKALLGWIDHIQGWLRSFLTVVWPGFHMRNAQSNFWQGWLMAGPRYTNPYWHQLATRILGGEEGSVTLGKKLFSFNEIRTTASELGTLSRGWVGLDNPAMIARELQFGLASKGTQVLRRAQIFTREGLPTIIGTRVGRAVENEARLAGFLINLADTGNPNFAAKIVRKFFFDYGELSVTESTLFRRGILFYTWIRKNIPLQLENLLKQPGKFSQIQKMRTYLTHLAEPPAGFEEEQPQYMKELYGIPTPFKDAQGNMLVYNPNFPWQDLGRVNVNDMYSALTPLIRIPFELVANREIYFARDISEYAGQTKPAPGYLAPLKYLPEKILISIGLKKGYDINTNAEILLMPAKAEYVARQLPFLTSLARSMPQVSESEKGAFNLLSTLGGIKFMPYEEKKATYYWTKDEMSKLEGLINELKKTHQWPELSATRKKFTGMKLGD